MPELIEVEVYRRLAEQVVGRTIDAVEADDHWFIKATTAGEVRDALAGATVVATGRKGKLLTLDLGPTRPVLGLRFGMTGRLVLDGVAAPIERLEYSSGRDDPKWDRFALRFADGARLRISDPRRLGGVELDPDLSRLGPDAAAITTPQMRSALDGSSAPLKARLLDQSRVAGLGNLLTDEILWRVGFRPDRPAGSVGRSDVTRLARTIRTTVADLFDRGGSHTGDLQSQRLRGGSCPRDGFDLRRETVGGRTTYWCPSHQR
ncbi:MAG: formamidopyrimidine-DNA glycosylase [Acidimicrobiales bacterium]|nr:formamidopyrimidine-DNA glycosylase [Acidimicrobiales bacterium]